MDVLVELNSGKHIVVEVEVEGQSTMIGAHQALKYRALYAGELDNGSVPYTFLVAYGVPNYVRAFCKRHDVRVLQLAPDSIDYEAGMGQRD